MKKFYFYFGVIGLLIILVSCNKKDDSLFQMIYPNNEFVIGAGLSPFEVHYFTLSDISTHADSIFSFHNLDKANVSSIRPRSARLSAIFANSTYDFIEDIEIRIFDKDPDKYRVLFFRDDLPFNTGKDLDLVPNADDVQEFLKNESFSIVIRMKIRDITPEFLESRLEFAFDVF